MAKKKKKAKSARKPGARSKRSGAGAPEAPAVPPPGEGWPTEGDDAIHLLVGMDAYLVAFAEKASLFDTLVGRLERLSNRLDQPLHNVALWAKYDMGRILGFMLDERRATGSTYGRKVMKEFEELTGMSTSSLYDTADLGSVEPEKVRDHVKSGRPGGKVALKVKGSYKKKMRKQRSEGVEGLTLE